MQSIQLIALITQPLDAGLPVMVRLMANNDLEFMVSDPDNLSDPTDNDNWEVMERCTAQDLEEVQEVVRALGGDPAIVCASFPNCTDY